MAISVLSICFKKTRGVMQFISYNQLNITGLVFSYRLLGDNLTIHFYTLESPRPLLYIYFLKQRVLTILKQYCAGYTVERAGLRALKIEQCQISP